MILSSYTGERKIIPNTYTQNIQEALHTNMVKVSFLKKIKNFTKLQKTNNDQTANYQNDINETNSDKSRNEILTMKCSEN